MKFFITIILVHIVITSCIAIEEPQQPEPEHIKLSTGVISKTHDPTAYLRAHPNDQEHALLSNTKNMYKSNKFHYYLNKMNNDRCGSNGCCCCLTEHSRDDGSNLMKDGNGKPINNCQNQRPSVVQMKSGYAVVFCETECIDTINGNLLHDEGDFVNDGMICMNMCDRKNNNPNGSGNDLNN